MNGNKPWVKACGRATEAELEALVQQNLMDGFWAAFYTDRFAAGRTADGVPLPTPIGAACVWCGRGALALPQPRGPGIPLEAGR